ncbi:MAG: hypothetical protein K6G79_04610 [Bacteroidales bacterium]|nr:hypothetical protein [Bacteroidales bacterium]
MGANDWELKVKERLADYRMDITPPPFPIVKRGEMKSLGLALVFMAVAAVVAMILLAFPRDASYDSNNPMNDMVIREPGLSIAESVEMPNGFINPIRQSKAIHTGHQEYGFHPTEDNAPEKELKKDHDKTEKPDDTGNAPEPAYIPQNVLIVTSDIYNHNYHLVVTGSPLFFVSNQQILPQRGTAGFASVDTVSCEFRPVKAGISFKKELSQKISLNVGVLYGFKYSEKTLKVDGEKTSSTSFHQHFAGLSLKADYMLYENDWFGCYLSAGGDAMVRLLGTGFSPNIDMPWRLDGHPLTISLTAAGGFDYKLNDNIGLFLEPGLSYDLFNSDPLPGFSKAHPLYFDLSAGLRIYLDGE